MSAPTSLSQQQQQQQQQNYESNLDKRNNSNNNNKDNKMSSANYMMATINNNNNNGNSAYPIDLIESKFNELAKKILDELKQSNYSREFFQAIDVILNEPPVLQHDIRARKLANHTRLNQKFIKQQEPSAKVSEKSSETPVGQQQKTTTRRHRQQVTSTIQSGVKQASLNTANMTVAKQKQRFSNQAQVVRSNTIGAGQMVRLGAGRQSSGKSIDDEPSDQQQHEPRSLGGLLTSHDISQLYKPHMNYSTSLLGNHRFSDDDEIIIIPTAQSPSLMSASVSPVGPHHQQQQQQYPDDQRPDRTTNNIDEFSERFSISRTKSFWEKLANSKSGGASGEDTKGNPSPQQDKQYFNSSQRSLSSGPNLVADSKSSQCSLLNQSGHSTGQTATGHHYPAAMKSAFDRMDSTGGSGNSHYSGCSSSSSTSGDEQTLTGHMNLAERRSMLASAATGTAGKTGQHQYQQHRGQPANASMNPTINQLVQQEQINRSDKFRQTR